MPWSIRLKTGAAKAINKLDKPVRDRIKTLSRSVSRVGRISFSVMRRNINDQHAAQYGYAY
ncbi:hypothetical protein [Methylomonas sp. ZR1]|uniref:hypothetical protein n=1 Tax=Methylomonas sp. ZR1 TaxID=1797072 RepID=UPI001C114DDA|nr:hypothetical protein [Methylomonas sp. ZR1]